jgi:hypothetical protein
VSAVSCGIRVGVGRLYAETDVAPCEDQVSTSAP